MTESMAAAELAKFLTIDACAPLAPVAPVDIAFTGEQRVAAYSSAGVACAVFSIVDDLPNSIEQTVKLIAQNRRFFLSQPQKYVLADNAGDIRRARAEGKFAACFAFQGTNALMGDLALVESYRRLGVIQMLLAYNSANFVADGCHETRNAGLTQFGRGLIEEMNRVGMIVDLTHVGQRSSLEALDLTTRPPIFSHSTPKHFVAHDRNITDEQIRACAVKSGVVCLSGVGLFMDRETQRATPARIAETIDYVVQLVGPTHAGIGLDYIIDTEFLARYVRQNSQSYGDGAQYPSDGYVDFAPPSAVSAIAEALMSRNYTHDDVGAILGGNYLRVLDANSASSTE
jgi:membrane dipeptidase